MKRTILISLIGLSASWLEAALLEPPSDSRLYQLSVAPRFGFNMSAKFKGLSVPLNSRLTPDGDPYNYDDGYVLTDISGNQGGQTWYWGYDDSGGQVSGNTVLMSRTVLNNGPRSKTLDDDISYGAELLFRSELGVRGRYRFGYEIAANYQNLEFSGKINSSSGVSRITDAYPFTPGTQPPAATPSAPYQGSFNGPGFVIGGTPSSSSTTASGTATITGNREMEGNLWGFRLGPYVEFPINERLSISLSGGAAVGLLDADAAWRQTISLPGTTVSGSAKGNDFDDLYGAYGAIGVSWHFNEHWSLDSSGQFQYLTKYSHSFRGQKVEMKLSEAVFATIGLTYAF